MLTVIFGRTGSHQEECPNICNQPSLIETRENDPNQGQLGSTGWPQFSLARLRCVYAMIRAVLQGNDCPRRAEMFTKSSEMSSVLMGIPWPALRGPLGNQFWKKRRPLEGERILEMLWKPQMPWMRVGFGASQPYSRWKFQETLWDRFQGPSGISSGKSHGGTA